MTDELTAEMALGQMAEALLARDAMRLRLLVQEWLRHAPRFETVPCPATADPRVLSAAAALIELLAERMGQAPPAWTAAIGALPEPYFVMRYAEQPGFTRTLCLTQSPSPLKKRTSSRRPISCT